MTGRRRARGPLAIATIERRGARADMQPTRRSTTRARTPNGAAADSSRGRGRGRQRRDRGRRKLAPLPDAARATSALRTIANSWRLVRPRSRIGATLDGRLLPDGRVFSAGESAITTRTADYCPSPTRPSSTPSLPVRGPQTELTSGRFRCPGATTSGRGRRQRRRRYPAVWSRRRQTPPTT